MNTVHYKLNETFYKRRSYTHHFDDMNTWYWSIYEELPNGSLLIHCPIRTAYKLQVERDEVDLQIQNPEFGGSKN
jgi:hypothetical protein